MALKMFAEIVIVYIIIFLRWHFTVDFILLVYSAIVFFLILFIKINAKYESYATNSPIVGGKSIVRFKEEKFKLLENATMVTNTPDFVFLKNSDTTFVIPMSEILMIETIDTAKKKR
jgi:hypothetical protein